MFRLAARQATHVSAQLLGELDKQKQQIKNGQYHFELTGSAGLRYLPSCAVGVKNIHGKLEGIMVVEDEKWRASIKYGTTNAGVKLQSCELEALVKVDDSGQYTLESLVCTTGKVEKVPYKGNMELGGKKVSGVTIPITTTESNGVMTVAGSVSSANIASSGIRLFDKLLNGPVNIRAELKTSQQNTLTR